MPTRILAPLLRLRDSNPEALVLISYDSDGAQIVRQARGSGLHTPIVAASSVYPPKFMELGGDAVNGVTTNTSFFPDDPRPEVQHFVRAFVAKYHQQPDPFNAFAHDAAIIAAYALHEGGLDRRGVRDAAAQAARHTEGGVRQGDVRSADTPDHRREEREPGRGERPLDATRCNAVACGEVDSARPERIVRTRPGGADGAGLSAAATAETAARALPCPQSAAIIGTPPPGA
jgi:hypothetical protein